MESILIYDTTLRDGTQGESINFSADDKLIIAKRLDDLGIHYIEGGWPGSNPKDVRFFQLAKRTKFNNAKLSAFGATRKPGIGPGKDLNLKALLESEAPVLTIFGKTWDFHVEQVMQNSLKENLAMIKETVSFLKDKQREVVYDAEHFFDGYKANPDYALKTLMAAVEGGAEFIVLCDTNGGTLPFEVESILDNVTACFQKELQTADNEESVKIGIHTHNDCGLAAANSIAAIQKGAVMVHGTINGYGERCGNADLTSIIPLLQVKMGISCISLDNLAKLKTVSRVVSDIANMTPLNNRPFVGESAFAHKGGIHVNAIMKNTKAYEHMFPEIVGNRRRVLVSDLSGKSNIEYKAKELGIDLDTGNGLDSSKIVSEIKRLEHDGYQFETANGSLKILLEKFTNQFKPFFELESFRITTEKDKENPCSAQAIIKVKVDGKKELTVAEGLGPISALDNALRKVLCKFYNSLDSMRLVDFKVRVIDGREGTAAKVRVFIESRDHDQVWRTIGVSEDIIEASWQALSDSFQFKLSKEGEL